MSKNTRFFMRGAAVLVGSLVASAGCGRGSGSLPSGSLEARQSCSGINREVDVNNDGTADIQHAMRGNAPSCSKLDLNFDGKIDLVRFYEAGGQAILHEQYDFDFDGRVDQLSFYEAGRLTRQELDTNFDNVIDTWIWCDAAGWVDRAQRDRTSNGNVDAWESYKEGLISEARYDNNNDGKPEKWEGFQKGKLIITREDTDNDGKPDRTDEIPLHSLGPADDALKCEQAARSSQTAQAEPNAPAEGTPTTPGTQEPAQDTAPTEDGTAAEGDDPAQESP